MLVLSVHFSYSRWSQREAFRRPSVSGSEDPPGPAKRSVCGWNPKRKMEWQWWEESIKGVFYQISSSMCLFWESLDWRWTPTHASDRDGLIQIGYAQICSELCGCSSADRHRSLRVFLDGRSSDLRAQSGERCERRGCAKAVRRPGQLAAWAASSDR